MSYKVVKNKERDTFQVEELATEKIIFEDKIYAKAYAKYRFLKEGGSFGPGGLTPDFIVSPNKYK